MNLFIERSLKNALDFFKEAVLSEDIARSKGLLQSLDPRLKIVLLAACLIVTCFARNIYVLMGLYAFSVALAVLSGIGVWPFIKRVWLFIPIFALLIAIPAIFTQGLLQAAVFVLRVAACVSFTVLVTVTTRLNRLLWSLGSLGVPALFIQVLDMTYRYIFLFIKVFEEMHLGLKARLLYRMNLKTSQHWIASRIATLFKRSVRMSEEVYLAMLARGYTGDINKYGK